MPLDTVMCLDISGSMSGDGMAALKNAVLEYLKGVTETAKQLNLRENVGVVVFGGNGSQILCNLGSNYNDIYQKVASLNASGTTPMYEGLMDALKEICNNGGVVTLGGGRIRLSPRIILFTDGKPNDVNKVLVAATCFSRDHYQNVGLSHQIPIACVGCGNEVDGNLLRAVAQITGGMYVQGSVSELSTFFRRQVLLVRFANQFQNDTSQLRDMLVLQTFLEELGEDTNDDEAAEMMKLLMTMVILEGAAEDLKLKADYMEFPAMPPLGARVRRGPAWTWQNQDHNGVGTVVEHIEPGIVKVMWDWSNDSANKYYFNQSRKDIRVVDDMRSYKTGDHPNVGNSVQRGPAWNDGNKDGGESNVGVIFKYEANAKKNCHVRWPNGNKDVYMFGKGRNEVVIISKLNSDELAAGLLALAINKRKSVACNIQ